MKKSFEKRISTIKHREIIFRKGRGNKILLKLMKGNRLSEDEKEILKLMYEVCEPKPDFLTIAGRIEKDDKNAIAVVGSRKITDYGRRVCNFIVKDLAAAGVTIVSGLMYGVDLCAHKAAISAGGRTIAVLGYGFDHLLTIRYSHPVVEDILVRRSGAIISEYPYYQSPEVWTFPKRNRIVSALSKATLIIEASRKSGSIITAGFALEQGKEVFVVPGSIFSKTSAGKHKLIKQGAILIDSAKDILDYLNLSHQIKTRETEFIERTLKKGEAKIYNEICETDMGLSLDDLVFKTRKPPSEISVIVTNLELKGLIKQNSAGKYFASSV